MPTAPDGTPLEIERKFLLDRLPELPDGVRRLEIEQGYLDPACAPEPGRVRRIRRPDGALEHVHTLKTGEGLVRTEVERSLSPAEFERLWPFTRGARLAKTRHEVQDGALTWEIDEFHGLPLVLAEVELPSAATEVTPPAWLAPRVVRDVTDERAFSNFELARRAGGRGDPAPPGSR